MQNNRKKDIFIVQEDSAGSRIDNFLSEKIPGKSRSHLQKLIGSSFVKVNDVIVSKNHRLNPGDIIEFTDLITLQQGFSAVVKPQNIPLNIVYEDDYYLIISKDAGISVHPSPGRYENTLVNALLFRFKNHSKSFPDFMGEINGNAVTVEGAEDIDTTDREYDDVQQCTGSHMRPGIIHRLDKDTSGLIIVAKDSNSQYRMAELFKNRQVEKIYLALVAGGFTEKKGKIDLPIGRSRIDRKKMSVSIDSGRNAVTEFEISESFGDCTLINAYPKTGRTHQIRVHFSYIDHPIVSDGTYGNSESKRIGNTLGLNRQFLHAQRLSFYHPFTNKLVEIEDEPAGDLKKSLEILRQAIK